MPTSLSVFFSFFNSYKSERCEKKIEPMGPYIMLFIGLLESEILGWSAFSLFHGHLFSQICSMQGCCCFPSCTEQEG